MRTSRMMALAAVAVMLIGVGTRNVVAKDAAKQTGTKDEKGSLFMFICLVITSIFSANVLAQADIQATYYVSPSGDDSDPGTKSLPFETITKARDVVRAVNNNMTGDIIVYLREGTYNVDSTIQFNQNDSGTNGYNVIYEAYPDETPVISGGQKITGWIKDGGSARYKAECGIDNFRQLWINGERAIRAKGGALPGATNNSTGHTTTDTDMQKWGNIGDVEFVYQVTWSESRIGVDSISGTTITMKQPGYGMARGKRGKIIKNPTYIENAFELLDEAGEWYLDRTNDILYYIPKTGEDISTAEVIVPVVEKLVDAVGALSSPIHNIQFAGITFAHATWLKPSGDEGIADIQAIWCPSADDSNRKTSWVKPMANVNIETAEDIKFERCKFIHLGGGVGLAFDNGSQDNTVSGCIFKDISGTGISLGNVMDYNPSDTRLYVSGNTVSNNYITQIGQEFRSGVGIFAGYVRYAQILHNYIYDVPYTGISVGWGWSDWSATCGTNNKINHNKVEDSMKILDDGGGIYTLGDQPNSECKGNYILDLSNHASLYFDENTGYYKTTDNVMENTPRWLNIWTSTVHDITIENTYTTTRKHKNKGTNCTVSNTHYYPNANWPQEALDIISNSGLERMYQDLIGGGTYTTP